MTNDVISITVDYDSKKMTFKKKNEKYELDFTTIPGDPLYPCALFYYMNDEVEFLPNYKEWLTSFDLLLHYLFIVIILFFHFLFSWARIFLNIMPQIPKLMVLLNAHTLSSLLFFLFLHKQLDAFRIPVIKPVPVWQGLCRPWLITDLKSSINQNQTQGDQPNPDLWMGWINY